MTRLSGRVARAALLAVCAGASLANARPALAEAMRRETLVIVTAGGRSEISTEIALTPAEQELGLMFRTSMGENDGMLFIYPKPQTIQMWMHNTYVPLDMVFVRADGSVAHIEANAEPLSDRVISSDGAASAVLELKAGTAQRIGLRPGDHIETPSFHATAP
jgi:uncharacterized membrane protein (UPF0127 family)